MYRERGIVSRKIQFILITSLFHFIIIITILLNLAIFEIISKLNSLFLLSYALTGLTPFWMLRFDKLKFEILCLLFGARLVQLAYMYTSIQYLDQILNLFVVYIIPLALINIFIFTKTSLKYTNFLSKRYFFTLKYQLYTFLPQGYNNFSVFYVGYFCSPATTVVSF